MNEIVPETPLLNPQVTTTSGEKQHGLENEQMGDIQGSIRELPTLVIPSETEANKQSRWKEIVLHSEEVMMQQFTTKNSTRLH